ncbi:hypothetical protein SLS62_006427 [Diatrype stigma]|uniref:Cytochrome P450 monooxygenase n=1 Tax=Diatrype stigma TaxID=117547 RepID=A0AAN9URF3_9PEZI
MGESLRRVMGDWSQSETGWLRFWGALVILLLTHQLLRLLHAAFWHPLARVPGPRLMAVSVLPMGRIRTSGRAPYAAAALHARYGPVVRIGPNEVSCAGPAAFRDAYGHRAGAGGPLPRDQRAVASRRAFGAVSLLQADVPTHARMRRRMNPAFSEKAARAQEPIVAGYVDALIQRLHEAAAVPSSKTDGAGTGGVVDMCQYLTWATFDIQGDLLFGQDVFGCLRHGRDHPWPTTTTGFFRALTWIRFLTEILPAWAFAALQKLLQKRGSSSQGKRNIADIMRDHALETKRMVDRRVDTGATDRPDYMSVIEREKGGKSGAATGGEEEDAHALSREEMYANAQVLMAAGSETVATVLSGALYLLLTHPAALARVQEEVRSAFAAFDNSSSSGSGSGKIDFASLARLEYLSAVLSETMRVWPPVATPFVRQVPRGDGGGGGCVVDGYYLPEGALVGVSNYATGRSERYFRHAERFVPERWLGAPEYAGDDREAFQPFGYGPMSCLGSALGRLELRLLLARLIWNFDIELMPESYGWMDNMEHYMVWQKPPLMVKLRPVRPWAG